MTLGTEGVDTALTQELIQQATAAESSVQAQHTTDWLKKRCATLHASLIVYKAALDKANIKIAELDETVGRLLDAAQPHLPIPDDIAESIPVVQEP